MNAGKRKVMVLGQEDELVYEICVDGVQLEHMSEFNYLGCFFFGSGTDEAECRRKFANERKVENPIIFLVIARDCSLIVLESCINISCACSYVWQ